MKVIFFIMVLVSDHHIGTVITAFDDGPSCLAQLELVDQRYRKENDLKGLEFNSHVICVKIEGDPAGPTL